MAMLPVFGRNSWMPDVFNDFFDNDFMTRANATAPAINVKESEKEYTVELAAPGLKKEDFNVNIDRDGNLHIRMESKDEHKASSLTRSTSRRCSCPTMLTKTPSRPR